MERRKDANIVIKNDNKRFNNGRKESNFAKLLWAQILYFTPSSRQAISAFGSSWMTPSKLVVTRF